MDDFDKGRRNDSSNVTNWQEFERGQQAQRNVNQAGAMFSAPAGGGMVITGESPVLQFLASIPFVVAGVFLYPITLAVTGVAALCCMRLVPLFGVNATWQRLLAYVPLLVVFWLAMRWEVRFAERQPAYRRARHVLRVILFVAAVYFLTDAVLSWRGAQLNQPFSVFRIAGAVVGAVFGHWFLTGTGGWRDFWYRTLARFRIRAAE